MRKYLLSFFLLSPFIVYAGETDPARIRELVADNLALEASNCASYYFLAGQAVAKDFTDAEHKKMAQGFLGQGEVMSVYAVEFGQWTGKSREQATALHASRMKSATKEYTEFLDKHSYTELEQTTGLHCKAYLEDPKSAVNYWHEQITARLE